MSSRSEAAKRAWITIRKNKKKMSGEYSPRKIGRPSGTCVICHTEPTMSEKAKTCSYSHAGKLAHKTMGIKK